jgi:hypothetical protein
MAIRHNEDYVETNKIENTNNCCAMMQKLIRIIILEKHVLDESMHVSVTRNTS